MNQFFKVGVLMYLIIKRVIDMVLSLIGLILLSPIFLIIIVAPKLILRDGIIQTKASRYT